MTYYKYGKQGLKEYGNDLILEMYCQKIAYIFNRYAVCHLFNTLAEYTGDFWNFSYYFSNLIQPERLKG